MHAIHDTNGGSGKQQEKSGTANNSGNSSGSLADTQKKNDADE